MADTMEAEEEVVEEVCLEICREIVPNWDIGTGPRPGPGGTTATLGEKGGCETAKMIQCLRADQAY